MSLFEYLFTFIPNKSKTLKVFIPNKSKTLKVFILISHVEMIIVNLGKI